MNRWQALLDAKPIPIVEHLLEEVAKRVAKELAQWPLPIEELDVATGRTYAPLLAPESVRPAPGVFTEAFRLTRWELERDLDAYDDYVRNQRWLERGLAPDDKLAMLFISRWLLEQLLGLGEATEGRVKRAQLRDGLDRIERRLARVPTPDA